MKLQLIIGIVLVVSFLVVGCSDTPTGEVVRSSAPSGEGETTAKPVVKIGATLPLTGDSAVIGEGMHNALLMAQKDTSSNLKYRYEVVLEDDQLDSTKAASASQKLINVDKVDAIVSISSGTGNVVTPIAEQAKVIHFGIASDANIAKGVYNFIHWTPPSEEAKTMRAELERRGITRVGAIIMQHPGAEAIMQGLRDELQGSNIKLVVEEYFTPGTKDFRTAWRKVDDVNPEVVVLMAFSPEIEIIAKQRSELGITTPVTAIEAFEFTEQPELFNGMWYVQAADATGSFTSKYRAAYNDNPAIGAPHAYDIFNLLVQGYETAGDGVTKPSRAAVARELTNIKSFDGALGELQVMPGGIVNSKAVVRKVVNGDFVTIR